MNVFFGQSDVSDGNFSDLSSMLNRAIFNLSNLENRVTRREMYPLPDFVFPSNMDADTPYAASATTPQSLLEWTQIPPEGTVDGQILFWDEDGGAEATGAWKKTDAPSKGEMLYWDPDGTKKSWQNLGVGTEGQVLKFGSSLPEWATIVEVPASTTADSVLAGDGTGGWIETATTHDGSAIYLDAHLTKDVVTGNIVWKTPYITPDELPEPTLNGQILRSTITGSGETEVKGNEWITVSDGDMIYGTTTGAAVLSKGSQGTILAMGSSRPEWVGGTLSNNDILQFNGTTWVPVSLSGQVFEVEINYGGYIHTVLATSSVLA